MRTATLRPGLLVALKTTVEGGVNYKRVDLDPEHTTEEGTKEARWETTRVVEDPNEFEAATKLRSKCRSMIVSVCSASDFGLLCPATKEEALNAAVAEATRLAQDFNATASRSSVSVYVLKGRVAADDAEAIRAINAEVRGLLEQMETGVVTGSVEAIREAANRARQLGTMLTDEAAGKVNAAIEQAREAARAIVKRVQKSGELADKVISELKVEAITTARFAFLDLDESKPVEPMPIATRAVEMEG